MCFLGVALTVNLIHQQHAWTPRHKPLIIGNPLGLHRSRNPCQERILSRSDRDFGLAQGGQSNNAALMQMMMASPA